ncbi:hypothetical protein AURDEDRAFT_164167 [Auricularia subglabra TFB-10046 SS5]|nr:hypothetical protein AURDEDRAFT_164167 [Auricularia subglabra TFB-10046 SS5]
MVARAPEHPRASAALAGLSLATQLGLAATDGIPIVKLILGVASRIVTLVEKIEKDRDALHSLAERAQRLAQRLAAVASKHDPNDKILASLENIYRALRAIESWVEKHAAKPRLRKAISYLLSVSKDVDRLSQDLQTTVDDFLVLAALDTNARVQVNSRYLGKFQLIHDSDVDKEELIAEHTFERSGYNVKCYCAQIEGSETGRVYAVRYFERKAPAEATGVMDCPGDFKQRLRAHDRVLQEISYANAPVIQSWPRH